MLELDLIIMRLTNIHYTEYLMFIYSYCQSMQARSESQCIMASMPSLVQGTNSLLDLACTYWQSRQMRIQMFKYPYIGNFRII